MTHEEMWKAYLESLGKADLCSVSCNAPSLDGASYEAWAFGGGKEVCDRLAYLVLEGVKTATASAHRLYGLEGEAVPKAGDYSVVLYDDGQAACVIRTTAVSVIPFCEVGERHAWLEGEGDRSLSYWREVHLEFFGQEFATAGLSFCEDELVVLEEFEVLYK